MADNNNSRIAYIDQNGLLYLWNSKLKTYFVAQVAGKGLSTNDLTDALKQAYDAAVTKLSGVEAGAEVNVIEGVQVNSSDLTPDANKKVNITVPTNNNQLTNGAGYQNATQVNAAIDAAIAGITGISFEIVQSLPQEGENGVIYLVPNSGTGQNVYDEYIWYTDSQEVGHFEKIGSTDVDLSGYVQTSDMVAITNAEIDQICV